MPKTFIALCCFAVLPMIVSCDQKNTAQKSSGVIPQTQLDVLNKAKDVQNVIQQGEQQRRAQAEQ